MGCSALLALTLSCLLLFQVCSAQFPWQSQQPQQQQCRQSQCRLDNLNALNPDRKVESEAGLSEYWDENNDQFQCAGVCHTIQRNGLLLPVFTNTPQLVYVVKDGMADLVSYGDHERDVEQALVALKKGTQLLKYSRKGKPKFRPFRLSADGTTLIWCSHGEERNLKLSTVSRIIPGQRTPVFRRFLRPEKDYLSFSLIYKKGERSLDLVCKDRAEVEVWLAGLGALVSTCQQHSRHNKSDIFDLREGCDSIPNGRSLSIASLEFPSSIAPGSFSTDSSCREYSLGSKDSDAGAGRANMHRPGDGMRISVSSSPSCSSGGSGPDDIESLGDVYVWGEVWLDSTLPNRSVRTIPTKVDVLSPKSLESNVVLDVHQIACGVRHVALVTRQGEVFTWGEESGGRLGHGIDKDFSTPHLVEFLAMNNVDFVACGEYHSCAVSTSGDLFTWGDGIHNAGLLGHGTDISHWIPKRITGPLEGLQVLSVACGTWHSALATSNGKVFTFGDGTFGVLGHGDQQSVSYPRQVQSLSGLRTIKVACGVWHTAAIVEVMGQPGGSSPSKKLFTWGDGDNYRLGHGNKDTYLLPTCVSTLIDYNFHQLACGHTMTVALTTSGHVFTMGGTSYGQLGNPTAKGKTPCLVQDKLVGEFVEEISCGAFHVAVMTSRSEIFTWGRGANGRLGHGDPEDRKTPTLVEALKDMHVKNISCGSNFTASICIHKWVSGADQSVCSGCRQAFGFTRKRHNCYNCGLVHCHSCSSKKAIKAALAPTPGKPHRVCDACYTKLKAAEAGYVCKISKKVTSNHRDYVNRGEIKSSRILLPPTIEPIKYLESRSAKPGSKYDYSSIVRASQVPSLLRLNDIAFPSSISAIQNALKPITPTSPQLVISSRSTPPYTRRPNSPLSTAPVFSRSVINNLKKTNDVLTKEVSKLQSQVKSLKHKNDVQDREIQRLHEDTGEAAYLVGKHSSKWREAKELIKSFTEQLKEMTEKLPQEISESETLKSLQARAEDLLNPTNEPSEISLSLLTNLAHNQQSGLPDGGMKENGHAPRVNRPSNYSTRDNEPQPSSENDSTIPESLTLRIGGGREVIEQFEPGVYITLLQLQNGTRIYRRVKFSKRKFSEQQAAEWWNNNKDRVYGRYCRTKATPVPAESPSTPAPFEENNEATPSSQA